MGIYLYTARYKSIQATLDSASVEIHLLKYSMKIGYHYRAVEDRIHTATLVRWQDKKKPDFIVLEKFEVGATVFKSPGLFWYDTDRLEKVGYLNKVGKVWSVVAEKPLTLKHYFEQTTRRCSSCKAGLNAKQGEHYPHSDGLPLMTKSGEVKTEWVYFTCGGCGYQNSFDKIKLRPFDGTLVG